MTRGTRLLAALGIFGAGYVLGTAGRAPAASAAEAAQAAQATNRVFEMRTYTAPPGRLGDLNTRFRDHTLYLFQKHGMKNVAYFVPTDTPQSRNTLVYLIAHDSREHATRSWAAFRADSTWIRAAAASQVNGSIVERVQSQFLKATDYSPIQ